MKILYITYVKPGTGGWIHATQFVKAVDVTGDELHVFPPMEEPKQMSAGASAPPARGRFREIRVLVNAFFRKILPEFREIRRVRPDAVILRAGSYFSSVVLCRLMGIPVVLELNGPVLEQRFLPKEKQLRCLKFWQWFEKNILIGWPNHVTVVSETLRQYYLGWGVDPDKVSTVPNGVDVEEFFPQDCNQIRHELGLEGKTVVGFSGHFSPWHGLPLLVEAMENVLARFPDVVLMLMGKPNVGFTMPDLPRDRVITTGYVSHKDMPRYLAAVDVFAVPYPKMELFYFSPLKMFEAMAMENAVVASAQGQILDLVQDGETGLLFSPGDGAALEEKLLKACADSALRQSLGANARQLMEKEFTWKMNGKRMVQSCQRAMQQSGPS